MMTDEEMIARTINFIDAKNDLVRFIRDRERLDIEMSHALLRYEIENYWLEEYWQEVFSSAMLYNPLAGI